MGLAEIFEDQSLDPLHWLRWENGEFSISSTPHFSHEENRETLARLFAACIDKINSQEYDLDLSSRFVRFIWNQEAIKKRPPSLPSLYAKDGFLAMYVLGEEVCIALFRKIWGGLLNTSLEKEKLNLKPICVEWNTGSERFFDVDATPPGILPKLFTHWRLKKDEELLKKIAHDMELISHIENNERRTLLGLAVLSHGAAYRELEGRILKVPSFTEPHKLIRYQCYQHLIAEGNKTISLVPLEKSTPGIYLCQGTELWPSQPSVLGSILANFAAHGSATEAYAHSWRRIHKHLRDLKENGYDPIVCGHSMGGSMAIQIGLYSHDLIMKSFAFNPPVPNERDYAFYQKMSEPLKAKIIVTANLDDFAFWRIGAKVIGNVTLFLGKKRWRYFHVTVNDCIFIFPAFIKFILNVRHAFPAHQKIVPLSDSFISVELTKEEIERENAERTDRFDYLHFLPKLYDPWKTVVRYIRKFFGWSLKEDYLCNEIEVIALHERDLIDTMTDANRKEIEQQLAELGIQKKRLQKQLKRYRRFH